MIKKRICASIAAAAMLIQLFVFPQAQAAEMEWNQIADMQFGEDTDLGVFVPNGAQELCTLEKTAEGVRLKRGEQDISQANIILRENAWEGAGEVTLNSGRYYLEAVYKIDGINSVNDRVDVGMRGPSASGSESASTNVIYQGETFKYKDSSDKEVIVEGGYDQSQDQVLGYELEITGTGNGNFRLYQNRTPVNEMMMWRWSAAKINRLNIAFNKTEETTMMLKSIRIWKYEEQEIDTAFEEDVNSLTEALILNGQDKNAVVFDLNLPKVLKNGTQVLWTSEPAGYVLEDGSVQRPEDTDQPVRLTASLTGPAGEQAQKQFEIVIQKKVPPSQEDVESVKYDADHIKLTDSDFVNSDFPLPLKGEKGSQIVWSSDNEAIVVDGDTARVHITQGSAPQVTLTAVITKGEAREQRQFILNIMNNIVFGKKGSASSVHSSGFMPDKAVDGDRVTSRWASKAGDSSYWLKYDLEKETQFNLVEIYDFNGRIRQCEIQGSHDDKEWETIQAFQWNNSGSGSIRQTAQLPASAYRYIRLMITKFDAEPSIYEFEVYNTEESATRKDYKALSRETVTDGALEDMRGQTKVLPLKGAYGSDILWESSDPEILSLESTETGVVGTVHAPTGADRTVRLTAKLTKDGCTPRLKTYLIMVKGERAGLQYILDEDYTENGLPETAWEGTAVLEDGKWQVSLSAEPARLYPLTKAVSAAGDFCFETDLYPQDGSFVLGLYDEQNGQKGELLQFQTVNGSWNVTAGGKTVYQAADNEASKIHLKTELKQNGTVLKRYINGELFLTEEITPGIYSIGLSSELGAKILLDETQVYAQKETILEMVAEGLTISGITSQPADAITQDLMFAEQIIDGIACRWTSSRPDVVSADGSVTRNKGTGFTEVVLTQTIFLTSDPEMKKEVQYPIHVLDIDTSNEFACADIQSNAEAQKGSQILYAADGAKDTAYFTAGKDGKDIQIVVTSPWTLPVCEIEINEAQADGQYHIKAYQVLVSEDGKEWTAVKEGQTIGESLKISLETQKIKAVKLIITAYDGVVGLAEIAVHTLSGGMENVPEADLEALEIPEDGTTLDKGFDIPCIGQYGSDFTVQTSPSDILRVTKISAEKPPYYRISLTKPSKTQEVSVQITAVYKDQKEERTYQYTVKGTGGSGGGSGSSSGGGSGSHFTGPGMIGSLTDNIPQGNNPNPQPEPFAQELKGHWGEKEIKNLIEQGIVKGTDDGSLALSRLATRAEFIAMLMRAMNVQLPDGSAVFGDVDGTEWFAPYIAAAARLGIVSGDNQGNIRPQDPVTREEMAKIIVNAYQKMGNDVQPQRKALDFTDADMISDWAVVFMEQAYGEGFFNGFEDQTIRPKEAVPREQMMVAVYRLMQKTQ